MRIALSVLAIGFVAAVGLYFARAEVPVVGGRSLQPPIGAQCSVWFRNDVYASAGKSSSDLRIGGRIKAISDEWLVLEGTPEEHWIPRNVIFQIEMSHLVTSFQPAK